MRIEEKEFSGDQKDFLADCRKLGIVLDICLLEFAEVASDYDISQKAAVKAMKVFARRYLEQLVAINPGRDVSKYFQIRIVENIEPTGERIDYQELLGEGFNFENNQVSLFHYSKGSRSSSTFDGFVHALFDPPYSLRIMPNEAKLSVDYGIEEQKRMTEFLFEFLDNLLQIKHFSDFANYEIYSWSDDWSNYFNAGKEWWGCFYWTFLNRHNKTITIIAASQTD